jgi:hypothetical protein
MLLLGGADSSDDEDAPVQDLLADPSMGLSVGAQAMEAAAAAAGAHGVLVKDILCAEHELRVSRDCTRQAKHPWGLQQQRNAQSSSLGFTWHFLLLARGEDQYGCGARLCHRVHTHVC